MVNFCPDCGSVLRKATIDGKPHLVCKCGYKELLEEDEEKRQKKVEQKKKELEENLIVVDKDDRITVNRIADRICPECGHDEAETWTEQTRSADEASTVFFRCVKCKHTWREY